MDELIAMFAAMRDDIESVPNPHDDEDAAMVAEMLGGQS